MSPAAVLVNCTGHQLLAGTGLAENHYGSFEIGNFPDLAEDFFHDHIAADDSVIGKTTCDSCSQLTVFLFQPFPLFGFLENHNDFIFFEGLGDEVVCTHFHALHGRFDCTVSRHHDDRNRDAFFHCPGEKSFPVHFGHADVAEYEIVGLVLYACQPFFTIGGTIRHIPLAGQHQRQHVPQIFFIIYYENVFFAHGHSFYQTCR